MTKQNDTKTDSTQVLVNSGDLDNLISAAKDVWYSLDYSVDSYESYERKNLGEAIKPFDKNW